MFCIPFCLMLLLLLLFLLIEGCVGGVVFTDEVNPCRLDGGELKCEFREGSVAHVVIERELPAVRCLEMFYRRSGSDYKNVEILKQTGPIGGKGVETFVQISCDDFVFSGINIEKMALLSQQSPILPIEFNPDLPIFYSYEDHLQDPIWIEYGCNPEILFSSRQISSQGRMVDHVTFLSHCNKDLVMTGDRVIVHNSNPLKYKRVGNHWSVDPIPMERKMTLPVARVTRKILKDGFHRELQTDIDFNFDCEVFMQENLDETTYIDNYEIHDANVFFSEPIDVERPSHTSSQHVVLFKSSRKDPSNTISFRVPLHLRYQPPSEDQTHRLAFLRRPLLFASCDQQLPGGLGRMAREGGDDRLHRAGPVPVPVVFVDGGEMHPLSMPVGRTGHRWMVRIGTLSVTLVGAVLIVWSVWSK